MTKEDFRAWREHMGLNRKQACDALGLGRNTPQRYEDGKAEIPRYVGLACAALAHGLQPWRPTMVDVLEHQIEKARRSEP